MAKVTGILCIATMFVGCMANQPVKWNKSGALDVAKGGKVVVKAECEMPSLDVNYLQSDIQDRVSRVLTGDANGADAYCVRVTITRYDEGSAFARFMLIGLGQMYLDGVVEVTQGNPPVVVRDGGFNKNYCVGGMIGGMATMQKDVLPKVGKAIGAALQDSK